MTKRKQKAAVPTVAPAAPSAPAQPRRRAHLPLQGGIGGSHAYDAATMFGQETAEWNPWLRSPDGEINLDRDRVVARTRDLVRNDGWANGSVTRLTDSAIGAQFRLVAKPDYRALERYSPAFDREWADEFGRFVEAEWRMWAEAPEKHCDTALQLNMTQLFRLALRHKVIDGDALAVMPWDPKRARDLGARYITSVQLIDPDRLSNPYQQMDTATMRGGVVIDGRGAPVGYHIRQAHQNDIYLTSESMRWDYLPRATSWGRPVVIHDFDVERRGQHRGVGILTPVLSRMKMLSRYDQTELQQAVLQTVFGMFVQSPYDPADVQAAMEEGELTEYQKLRNDHHKDNPLSINGVRVPVLPPGEEVKTVNATRPNSGFDTFQSAVLRSLASNTGQSAEQITWDYSKTNYSSARAAMLEAWKTLVRRRADFSAGFANPVYGCFLEEVMDRPGVPLPRRAPEFREARAAYMRCLWIGPARGWVDPVAERQGAVLGLDAGFGTLESECAEQGLDYEEVLDQRALEVEMMKKRDLPLPQWAAGAPAQTASKPQQEPQPA